MKRRTVGYSTSTLGATILLIVGCGGGTIGSTVPADGTGASNGGKTGGDLILAGPAGGSSQGGSTGQDSGSTATPPQNFVPANIGAYALGDPISAAGVQDTGVTVDANGCTSIAGVVRDFKGANEPGGHPDFEAFSGAQPTPGLVGPTLGSDGKPVYTGICEQPGKTAACPYDQQTTSKQNFDEWYRFTDGVNKPYLIYFQFVTNNNVSTFESTAFFPLDGQGWGNSGKDGNGLMHNFGFTTELHTKFTYNGGEVFQFTGDDDLWVFINGKLAMDLGGLHPQASNTITLDQAAAALGIEKGTVYPLELFHAERHTVASDFRVDTTGFSFVDCGGTIPPQVR